MSEKTPRSEYEREAHALFNDYADKSTPSSAEREGKTLDDVLKEMDRIMEGNVFILEGVTVEMPPCEEEF